MLSGLNLRDWLAIITSFVGVIVIPFTLLGIWRSRVISQEAENWKARQEEIGTYNDINNRYSEFLRTMLVNADVDIGEFHTPSELNTPAAEYKRKIMYAMLVTLMERAYLLYMAIDRFDTALDRNHDDRTRFVTGLDKVERLLFGKHPKRYETHIFKTQWPGWLKYFEFYCGHKAFQEYWNAPDPFERDSVTTQWHDTEFEEFVNRMIERAMKRAHTLPYS